MTGLRTRPPPIQNRPLSFEKRQFKFRLVNEAIRPISFESGNSNSASSTKLFYRSMGNRVTGTPMLLWSAYPRWAESPVDASASYSEYEESEDKEPSS